MTSRERIQKTINFQEPDRVPIDLGAMKASGISAFAYRKLRDYLALQGEVKVLDPRFMIADIDDDIRKKFHVDVMAFDMENAKRRAGGGKWISENLFDGAPMLFPPGTGIIEDAAGNRILLDENKSPTSYRMPANGFYFDDVDFDKIKGGFNPSDFKPQDSIPEEDLDILSGYGKHLYENTEYALLGWGFGVCFLGLSLITNKKDNVTLSSPSQWMMMLMTEKDTCHEMMKRSVDASISCLKLVNQAAGDVCFAWGIGADDSGTQRGEFINPDLWAEMIKPHYARLCSWIHENTNWKTFFHCCGSVSRLIPHFIEAGIDILNPVQTSAANMDPDNLKCEFGGRIVFWGGGCDTQRVLGSASAEEVRDHVKKRVETFAPGGGYVFNQVHNIQANVPPENIEAMLEAAYEYGRYY